MGCKQAAGGWIGVARLRSDARVPTEPAHTPHSRSVGHGAPLRVAETLNAPLKTRHRPHFGRAAAGFVRPVDPCANSRARRGLRPCVARLPTSPISASASAASAASCTAARPRALAVHGARRGHRCPAPSAVRRATSVQQAAVRGPLTRGSCACGYVQAGIETPRPQALAVKISASSGNCVASADP